MTAAKRTAVPRVGYRALLHVAICAAALLMLPPWIPAMPRTGLDPSWAMVLNHAFVNHWQFGSDLVFTFGPFGFLYARLFDPATYAWMLAAWVAMALVIGAGTAFLLRHARPWEAIAIAALLLLGLRAGMLNRMIFSDAPFFLIPLLLGLTLQHAGRAAKVIGILACVLAALASLVKFTFWMLGLAMVVMLELGRVSQGKRLPGYLLTYVAASLTFNALAGQSLAGFARFVSTSLVVASGYSEAMQVWSWQRLDLVAYLVLAAAFVAVAGYLSWRTARARAVAWTDWLPLVLLVLFMFMVFKAGFVRHDSHAVIAWGGLTAGLALSAAHFVPRLRDHGARGFLILICSMSAAIAVNRNVQYAPGSPGGYTPLPLGGSLIESIDAIRDFARGSGFARLGMEHAAALEGIRQTDPLPRLPGSVDVYPWNAAAVLAHGLDYRPRPVFQSFAAYNPRLVEINRRHLEGGRAASTLVFGLESIDGRLVAQDEGALWPTLFALYEVDATQGSLVVMHRRSAPLTLDRHSDLPVPSRWNEDIAVPQTGQPVWVQIRLQRTAWGRVQDFLLKSPVVDVVLELADGTRRKSRLVPPLSGEPFLLSPIVSTAREWADLFGRQPAAGAAPRVVKLRIVAPVSGTVLPVYSEAIEVTFSRVALNPRH